MTTNTSAKEFHVNIIANIDGCEI